MQLPLPIPLFARSGLKGQLCGLISFHYGEQTCQPSEQKASSPKPSLCHCVVSLDKKLYSTLPLPRLWTVSFFS